MRMYLLTALIAIFTCFASSAKAESAMNGGKPGTSAMHYTKVRTAPPENTTYIKHKTIAPDEEEAKKEEAETPEIQIWNKYKALAAGQDTDDTKKDGKKTTAKDAGEDSEDKAETAETETDEDPEQENGEEKTVKKEKLKQEPARPSGIAGLIDEYKRNRAMQSQMRSITVNKPAEVEPAAGNSKEKPEG